MIHKKQESWKIKKDLIDYAGYQFNHKANNLVPNWGSEGIKHYTIKAMVSYILRELKREFYDEVIVCKPGSLGRIDIFDITNRIIIEVHTGITEEIKAEKKEKYDNPYIVDFLFIEIKKVPENMQEAYKYLKNKIEKLESD